MMMLWKCMAYINGYDTSKGWRYDAGMNVDSSEHGFITVIAMLRTVKIDYDDSLHAFCA